MLTYLEKLRGLREDNDLTQTQVANILGTSQTMYARYERGANEMPIRHLVTLCRLYNVSVDYLLDTTPDLKRKQKRIMSDTSGKYEGMKAYLTSNDGTLTGILGKFSTSMNQFESRAALENMLARMNRMKARGYESKIMNQTKENYIKNLEPTFRGKDDKFLEHLRKMNPTEFFNRRGSNLTDDFLYINSKPRATDDIYIVDLVHSFGWLSIEEQMNGDTAFDKFTGKPIMKEKVKPKQTRKRAKN